MLYPRLFVRTFQVQYESNLIGAQCFFFGTTSVLTIRYDNSIQKKRLASPQTLNGKKVKEKDPYLQVTTEDKFNVPNKK